MRYSFSNSLKVSIFGLLFRILFTLKSVYVLILLLLYKNIVFVIYLKIHNTSLLTPPYINPIFVCIKDGQCKVTL